MTDRKTVPVAYVTKWAATKGIVVVRDAEITESGAIRKRWLYVPAKQWTVSRSEAESCWRVAVNRAANLARKRADKLLEVGAGAPKCDPKER